MNRPIPTHIGTLSILRDQAFAAGNKTAGAAIELALYALKKTLPATEETLHDRYTMAALTGLLSVSSDVSIHECVERARYAADEAIRARGVES